MAHDTRYAHGSDITNQTDDIEAHEAAVKRRKSISYKILSGAFIVSGVATERGFELQAQASGATDFHSMLFAVMVSIVAAMLMAGACKVLIDVASELGES